MVDELPEAVTVAPTKLITVTLLPTTVPSSFTVIEPPPPATVLACHLPNVLFHTRACPFVAESTE